MEVLNNLNLLNNSTLNNAAIAAVSLVAREEMATFTHSGVITVGTGTHRFRFPFAATLLGVSASVSVDPTGSSLIFDVNKNGTTIFTTQGNRPTIAASGFATTTEPAPDVVAIVAGDYLTIDRDQIGSTVSGSDAVLQIRYRRS